MVGFLFYPAPRTAGTKRSLNTSILCCCCYDGFLRVWQSLYNEWECLNSCVSILQRQQRLQKERLMNDFSTALNNFQAVQRRVSEKEKETVARARAGSRISVSIYGNLEWCSELQVFWEILYLPSNLIPVYWHLTECSWGLGAVVLPFQVLEVISRFSVLQCQCRGGKESW